MDIGEIKRLNLRLLAEKYDERADLSIIIGYSDTDYVNQLCKGHSPIVKKSTAKIHQAFDLKDLWLETPHHGSWASLEDKKYQKRRLHNVNLDIK